MSTPYKSFRKDGLIALNVEKDTLIEDQKALIAELKAQLDKARASYKELQASCRQRVAQNAKPAPKAGDPCRDFVLSQPKADWSKYRVQSGKVFLGKEQVFPAS